ncbi:MAG: hypothetical protein AB1705_19105 [Verrucomicrobiota bacterium]
MKTILLLLAAAGISAGATYLVVSNKKTAEFAKQRAELQAQWDTEKEKLERDLKRARSTAPRVETTTTTVEVPVDGRMAPAEIIQRLSRIQPTSEAERANQLREIIHLLETLREHGQAGVPAIRGFLAQNQDIDYEPASRGEGDGERRFGDRGGGFGGDRGPGDRGPGDRGPGGFRGRGDGRDGRGPGNQ